MNMENFICNETKQKDKQRQQICITYNFLRRRLLNRVELMCPHSSPQHSPSFEKQTQLWGRRALGMKELGTAGADSEPWHPCPLQRQLRGRQGEQEFRAKSELTNGWIKLKMCGRHLKGTTSAQSELRECGIWHLWTNQQQSTSSRRKVQSCKSGSISQWKGKGYKAVVRRKNWNW